MPRESTQHKLDRVRRPRVHITYDVQIGDAIEMKELPFVMASSPISPANPMSLCPVSWIASSWRSIGITSMMS
jgi:type VI secretion system protein ImpB